MEVVAGKCDLRAVDFDEALIVEVEGQVVVVALLSKAGEEVGVELVLEEDHWIDWFQFFLADYSDFLEGDQLLLLVLFLFSCFGESEREVRGKCKGNLPISSIKN